MPIAVPPPLGISSAYLMTLSVDPDRVADLLPDHWRVSHPEQALTHRLEESRENARRRDARRADRRQGK
ncbi:hypothetical protein [Singulisphaera acidiphila]|uniref:hypothetical protein n=1 Tax=Singulisphaera acidiphila TaxID=466153 RepID=UPI0009DAC7E4|nr:hypothetical protein [Singulisphaera acidiphila]